MSRCAATTKATLAAPISGNNPGAAAEMRLDTLSPPPPTVSTAVLGSSVAGAHTTELPFRSAALAVSSAALRGDQSASASGGAGGEGVPGAPSEFVDLSAARAPSARPSSAASK